MFTTFRSQMLFVLTCIMLVSSVSIMYFTHQWLGKKILDREKSSIQNIFSFIQRDIKNKYDDLLFFKADTIRNSKHYLKNMSRQSIVIFNSAAENIGQIVNECGDGNGGGLQDKDKHWSIMIDHLFNALDPGTSVDWLLMNEDGSVYNAWNKKFRNVTSASLLDMNGNSIRHKIKSGSLSSSGEFAVFQLPEEQGTDVWRLGYFLPTKRGNMTLCALLDISSLVKEEERKKNQIITQLDSYMASIKIAKTGFVFVFDGQQNILISDEKNVADFFLTETNPDSGQNYLSDFMAAGGDEQRKEGVAVSVAIDGSNNNYAVYTSYFEGFEWYTSIALPVKEIQEPVNQLVIRQIYVIGGIFLISFLLCVYLVSKATDPLHILSEKIDLLPIYDFSSGDNTGLTEDLPLSSNNEIGRLAQSFSFMIDRLCSNVQQLVETTALNERMEGELNVAREIQLGSLPTDFSFDQKHNELDIYAYLIPAREIGGDLYDFYFIDDDHLCFTLGDVAGKGVPAALFMVTAKKLIKNNAYLDKHSPAEIMTRMNEMLYQDNPNATFVTLFIGILNVKTGEICYANGGHNPPIFTRNEDIPYYKKGLSGPVVGVIPGIDYEELSITLQPGEAIFLYTDGVTEAMNEEEQLFSDKKLLDDFTRMADSPPEAMVKSILEEVRVHAGEAPQSDDIAMLMIRWKEERA